MSVLEWLKAKKDIRLTGLQRLMFAACFVTVWLQGAVLILEFAARALSPFRS
jgi:hypothetical protein